MKNLSSFDTLEVKTKRCASVRHFINYKPSKIDEMLMIICKDNVNGVVEEATRVNNEVMDTLGISRNVFDKYIGILKSEGLLIREGYVYHVHPYLKNIVKQGDEQLIKLLNL